MLVGGVAPLYRGRGQAGGVVKQCGGVAKHCGGVAMSYRGRGLLCRGRGPTLNEAGPSVQGAWLSALGAWPVHCWGRGQVLRGAWPNYGGWSRFVGVACAWGRGAGVEPPPL